MLQASLHLQISDSVHFPSNVANPIRRSPLGLSSSKVAYFDSGHSENRSTALPNKHADAVSPRTSMCSNTGKHPSYDEHEVALMLNQRREATSCNSLVDVEVVNTLSAWEPPDPEMSRLTPNILCCQSVRSRNSARHRLRFRESRVRRVSEADSPCQPDASRNLVLRYGAYASQFDGALTRPRKGFWDTMVNVCFKPLDGRAQI